MRCRAAGCSAAASCAHPHCATNPRSKSDIRSRSRGRACALCTTTASLYACTWPEPANESQRNVQEAAWRAQEAPWRAGRWRGAGPAPQPELTQILRRAPLQERRGSSIRRGTRDRPAAVQRRQPAIVRSRSPTARGHSRSTCDGRPILNKMLKPRRAGELRQASVRRSQGHIHKSSQQ
jgi:hypothetical protein